MKNTMKTLATAAFLLTSTFASAQELTEEAKKIAEIEKQNDALVKKYIEEERAASELELAEDKKWSKLNPINPDALTGKPQGFATRVFYQEMTLESTEVYSLRIDVTNEKVLDKFVIFGSYRFPFDVKSIRMVFHKGGDAVSVPVRRGKSGPRHDQHLIIDNPLAVERVFDLLEAQGSVKMELKMDYKFDTITRIVSFDTSNIPKEIIVER